MAAVKTSSPAGPARARCEPGVDGRRLGSLVQLLAQGVPTVPAGDGFPLERAGEALAQARHGAHGSATVLRTAGTG
jgi:hypothetical protein